MYVHMASINVWYVLRYSPQLYFRSSLQFLNGSRHIGIVDSNDMKVTR